VQTLVPVFGADSEARDRRATVIEEDSFFFECEPADQVPHAIVKPGIGIQI
jgi:hypothetical protein